MYVFSRYIHDLRCNAEIYYDPVMNNTNAEFDLTLEKNFCEQILNLDKTIRFAGITNNMGDMITAKYGKNTAPLLSGLKAEISAFQSTTRMVSIQEELGDKLGKIIYVSEVFENIKRVTISLENYCFLLISFDVHADHDAIIVNKILPLVRQIHY